MNIRWDRFYKDPAKYLDLKSIRFANPGLNLPDDEVAFLSATEELAIQKIVLFYNLLTSALICDDPIPSWLINWFNNMALELSISSYDEIANSSWIAMPLLTTVEDQGCFIHLYIGIHIKEKQDKKVNFIELNGSSFFDKSAVGEIESVWDYWGQTNCQNSSLSILYYSNNNIEISGRSLGLPLALSLDFLSAENIWPKGLFATGALQNDQVTKVEGLSAKYQCILQQFKNTRHAFIYPKETIPPDNFLEKICYPVSTLSQAREYSDWFINDIDGDFELYKKCLSSPELFCNNIGSLPLGLIEYTVRNDRTPISFNLAHSDYQFWKKVVTTLSEMRKESDKGWYFLHLFSIDEVSILAEKDKNYARQCFKWAALAVSVANHKGQIKEATSWYNWAITFEEYAPPKDFIVLLNRHEMVNNRHNYYDFRPELPLEFSKVLARRKIKHETGDDDYALASLFASQSQNFGFCGPQFLRNTIKTSNNAIEIFTEPEDICRQYNYQAYAYLDAKEYQNAWQAISLYLDFDPQETILEFLTKTKLSCQLTYGILPKCDTNYVLALLCRFVAEKSQDEGSPKFWDYFKPVLSEIFNDSISHHPIQLILINIGCIAWQDGDRDNAQKAWQKSIDVCLTSENTTIEPMALLGFSRLYNNDLLTTKHKLKVGELLKKINNSSRKTIDHFSGILELPIETALHKIAEIPQQFFPFSYR